LNQQTSAKNKDLTGFNYGVSYVSYQSGGGKSIKKPWQKIERERGVNW
jgi:hypothetical protein